MVLVILLVMSLLLGTGHFYLARRTRYYLSPLSRRFPRKLYNGFFILSTLLMAIGFARSMLPIPQALRNLLSVINAYHMAIFVCLLVFVVLLDLLLLLGRLIHLIPHPHYKSVRIASFGIAVLLALGSAGYGFWHATEIRHVSYDLSLSQKSLEDEFRIVLVSDLHIGAVGSESRLEKIVSEINRQAPDLVCIVGDIFDNDFDAIRDPARVTTLLQSIQSVHGVYACFGNHDSGATFAKMERLLSDAQICVLKEEYTVIDDRLVLIGRLDASPIGGYDEFSSRGELSKIMSGIDTSLPIVVMDHNPAHIDEYDGTVDLILSGHTHRGQVFPGSVFTRLMYTVDYGHYQKDAASPHVIVTSGAGAWGMPMRIGTDCEVVTIHLK